MKCGLLGRKLGHSYSPQIHACLADYSYELFEKEPGQLENFLKNGDFTGLNVTIPYKKDVIPYLDELTPVAQKMGAVNTIVRREGRLIGHNTDYFGFLTMVRSSGVDVKSKKTLVLGSGGASNTAVAVLEELGAKVFVISRNGENNYGNLHLHADTALIVNATPVGMYPNVGKSPVDLDLFPKLEGVLDVVYNPARTQILLDAEKRGIVSMNGLLMLVAQAKEAAEWFSGICIPDEKIAAIHKELRLQMENIILIGMPGCGKTTIGTALAEKLGKKFLDADAALVENTGRNIPEIFATDGEPGFRTLETETLADLGRQSGLVIATGGGCVTQLRNYPLLHQNGTIFWLTRDLSKLPTDGRPLSQTNRLTDMYAVRKPLYEAFADHQVDNDGDLDTTISRILEELK
ncbi:MAG: AAA family ATPase [Oscillospiraceae bacterium]|nr:AAA family ATPase [Oscillospiraceae bacterium]